MSKVIDYGRNSDAVMAAHGEMLLNPSEGRIEFTTGDYVIDKSIDFERARGVLYEGAGCIQFIGQGAPNKATVLTATGNLDAMIKWAGSTCVFQRMSIYGRSESDPSTQIPDIGFLVYRAPGVGCGKSSFNDMVYRFCDVGFQCSLGLEENNHDYISHWAAKFRECRIGYLMNSVQSVGHVFSGVTYLTQLETAFRIEGGGNLTIDHCITDSVDTFLSTAGQSSYIGKNNGNIRVGSVWFDNNNPLFPRILAQDDFGGAGARIVKFDSLRLNKNIQQNNSDPERYLFKIGGQTFLHVQHATELDLTLNRVLDIGTPISADLQPKALFEYCGFSNVNMENWLNGAHVRETVFSRWMFRECYVSETGEFLPTISQNWS